MDTPEYKVIADSFMEPNHVKAGSIVRTWGPPGPHLQPLNASAIQKMEEWYSEEFDEFDPKTGKPTGVKVRPHEKFRIRSSFATPEDKHFIEIVSGPTKEQPGSLSLAETLANPKRSTDQRPGPAYNHIQPAEVPGSTAPVLSPPQQPEPTMDASVAVEQRPQTPPEPLVPEPSTPPEGSATLTGEPSPTIEPPTLHEPIPSTADNPAEPVATEVVFSAPPPSARRNS